MDLIPFNKPYISGSEKEHFNKIFKNATLSGDGLYGKKSELLIQEINKKDCLLTNSCTAALEMSAILARIKKGDEVVMPSYTFVSTANAFVLRGGKPIFVDINPRTMNIDEKLVERLITKKTKCIVPVHYGGISCDLDHIKYIAEKNNLIVIEDAAQAIGSKYKNKPLGAIGDLGTFSFHETKNITCGEGGALSINNPKFIDRAFHIREKGTNRREFIDRKVDKYSWIDIGSSYLPSEMQSAFLFSQLSDFQYITKNRSNNIR